MSENKRSFDSPSRGGSSSRGGGRGGGSSSRGRDSNSRGGASSSRGGGNGSSRGGFGTGANGPDGEREKKEPFKPKEGFIAAGLKAYTETAEAAKLAAAEEISTGWKDKTTTQTTLHLTHLPPNLTSPQLSLICSSYAPLRSAFVVSTSSNNGDDSAKLEGVSSANATKTGAGRDRTGKSASRGFGYVRFVLRTDAEKCIVDWGTEMGIPRSALKGIEGIEGSEGIEWDKVCGRGGIKMAWAKKKLKEGEEPEGGVKEKKIKEKKQKVEKIDYDAEDAPARPVSASGYDREGSRTVIVQGLSVPLTEEEIEAEKERKAAKMEVDTDDDAEEIAEDAEEKEEVNEDSMVVDGKEVVAGKEIDWKKALKQKAKKWGDVESVSWPVVLPSGETVATILLPTPRLAHALSAKLHNHVFKGLLITAAVKSSWDLVQRLGRGKGGGRLVVRNLGFDVTIPDLRSVFSKFGPLHSITLPLDQATNAPRGFAFIYYLSLSSATTALEKINATRIYSGMAQERVDSEGGKGGNKKAIRQQKKKDDKADGGGGGEKGRVVAVDWAVGKDEFKRAQLDGEPKATVEASGSENDSDEDSEEEDDEEEKDDDSDMSPVPEGAEEEEEERHADDDDDELEEEPQGPEPAKGTTLFVRNMSFEATESELYDLFKVFGPVRYARIVFDPTTKRSRGTAFVCFWNDEDAQKVLYESEVLNAGLYGETSNKNKPAGSHSLLMADPGSSTASKLVLHGRVLAAVSAVSKTDADGLREDRDKKGAAKTDRRNLYLMREGVIFPSWVIAQTLHPTDLSARQSSFDARKGLLRSNPSLYISRTRLSVRQIPLYVSDGMMKRLANYAMKEFEKDVKNGHQKALTGDEKSSSIVDAGSLGGLPAAPAERMKGVPPSRVRQAKILRQADRVDPLTGLGRSKGYGFLELATHGDALRVLRWANANRDVGALFRGWWRETLEKMIERVESGESVAGSLGKGVTVKDKEERLKRLREKMSELVEEEEIAMGKAAKAQQKGKVAGEGGRNSKCLIVEFSIENAVTTKRRAEKADRSRERAKRTRDRDVDSGEEETDDEERSTKRRKPAPESAIASKVKAAKDAKSDIFAQDGGDEEEKRKGLSIGAIIGKKRRKGKGN